MVLPLVLMLVLVLVQGAESYEEEGVSMPDDSQVLAVR